MIDVRMGLGKKDFPCSVRCYYTRVMDLVDVFHKCKQNRLAMYFDLNPGLYVITCVLYPGLVERNIITCSKFLCVVVGYEEKSFS